MTQNYVLFLHVNPGHPRVSLVKPFPALTSPVIMTRVMMSQVIVN